MNVYCCYLTRFDEVGNSRQVGCTENVVETPLVTVAEVGGHKWALWEMTEGAGMARLVPGTLLELELGIP